MAEFELKDAEEALNVAFLVFVSIIIFRECWSGLGRLDSSVNFFLSVMQGGFAFLEAGSVRAKNTTNILLKNVISGGKGPSRRPLVPLGVNVDRFWRTWVLGDWLRVCFRKRSQPVHWSEPVLPLQHATTRHGEVLLQLCFCDYFRYYRQWSVGRARQVCLLLALHHFRHHVDLSRGHILGMERIRLADSP